MKKKTFDIKNGFVCSKIYLIMNLFPYISLEKLMLVSLILSIINNNIWA